MKKFPDGIKPLEQERIKKEMLDAIGNEVLPAYMRFARFLEVSYVPACRTEPGISSVPNGAKYYQFLIRQSTTTDLTADQIHQIGLDEVKRDEAEMLAIAKKMGFADLAAFRASLAANPKLKATSGDAVARGLQKLHWADAGQTARSFSDGFQRPGWKCFPVPDYLEKVMYPAYYEDGTPDGSRPGHLRVNEYNATDRNLYAIEAVAYHEGIPGHHLQISIAQETEGLPAFRKFQSYTAFVEGWALYSERLGKEVGFYQDPYSDYGRLQADMWRAIRLVIDTGVHSQHWTRDQMVQYFHDHSSIEESTVQTEVDRYIGWPARHWHTRSVSLRSWNCATAPKKRWATSSICAPFTMKSSIQARCRSMC